jgi:hypothetical protein
VAPEPESRHGVKIGEIRRESTPGGVRIAADVEWEDCGRPPREISFAVGADAGDALTATADAFLTGCIVPAARHGERRISVRGTVCPRLRDNLDVALAILGSWRGVGATPIAIEAPDGFRAPRPAPARAGMPLSGGVDSLFTLRMNRLTIAPDHPAFIRTGIFLLGHDLGLPGSGAGEFERFDERVRSLGILASGCGIDLLPMRFNLRDLDDDLDFYVDALFGAALAAAGHALSSRLSSFSIASSYDIRHITPQGSHPYLDAYFSSSVLAVRHDGAARTRLEKLRLLAEWPEALERLQTCNYRPPPIGRSNCGTCEKCLRTSVGLLVLGRLGRASGFSEESISPDTIRAMAWAPGLEEYWGELVGPLLAIGRDDLARAVEERLRETRLFRAWRDETDWKGRIKRFDRRYLGGLVAAVARATRARDR